MFHVDFPAAVIHVSSVMFLLMLMSHLTVAYFISRFAPGQTLEIFETSLSYFGRSGPRIGVNVGLALYRQEQ
jgi:hypothetical protein